MSLNSIGILAVIGILSFLIYFYETGHPIWIIPRHEVSSTPYNLMEPIEELYKGYDVYFMPHVTTIRLPHKPLSPMEPREIFDLLHAELNAIGDLLVLWTSSSYAGQPSDMSDLVFLHRSCRDTTKSLASSYKGFVDVVGSHYTFWSGYQPAANFHLEPHEKIVNSAIWYWEFEQKGHEMMMDALKNLDKRFEVLGDDDSLFKIIEAQIRPLAGDGDWADGILRSIEFTRAHILRLFDTATHFVRLTMAQMEPANKTIDAQLSFWRGVATTNLVTHSTIDEVWRGIPWIYTRTSLTKQYFFPNTTSEAYSNMSRKAKMRLDEFYKARKISVTRPLGVSGPRNEQEDEKTKKVEHKTENVWWFFGSVAFVVAFEFLV